MGHASLARCAPAAGVGTVGVLAVLTGLPWVALLAVAALLALTPWARTLAVRAMIGLLLVLFVGGAVTVGPPVVRWTTGWLALLVAGMSLLQVLVSVVRRDARLLPRLDVADGVALVGGGLLTVMLGIPYVGGSADDVLLDLARGFDSVNHVLGVANLMVEHGTSWAHAPWSSVDGSQPVMAGYPLGFHAVIASALSLAGIAPTRDIVVPYAWAAATAMGLCAAVLGWIAARIAASLGSPGTARMRATCAALGYAACALLGGGFVAPLVLGHAPFVLAATAGITASWLALELLASEGRGRSGAPAEPPGPSSADRLPSARQAAALGVLFLGSVALLGAYPPLVAGLIPAGVVWVWHWSRPQSRRWARPLVPLGLLLLPVAMLWLFRGRVEHLIRSVGENSTPFIVSVVLVTLTAAAAWVAWDQRWGLAPVRGLAVAGGYVVAALTLAFAAVGSGLPASESYYGTKLAEAAWLAALPVLLAVLAGTIEQVTAWRSGPGRLALAGFGMLALALLFGALPIGRTERLLVGPGELTQRLVEAHRAQHRVQVLAAARLAGPSTGDASAMVEPAGWFYPVAHEDDSERLRREAVSAALWLATLRGVRTQDQDLVAACFAGEGGVDSLPCVARWLRADPDRRITLVVRSSALSTSQVQAWASRRADQVRVLVLPEPSTG